MAGHHHCSDVHSLSESYNYFRWRHIGNMDAYLRIVVPTHLRDLLLILSGVEQTWNYVTGN